MIKVSKKVNIIILIAYSFIMRFFHSFASFRFGNASIYSDNAVFYLAGKAILEGKILYKEIFDHKAPYIHFINAFTALFDYNHIGLYIVESIILFTILYFTYKIVKLFIEEDIKIYLIVALIGYALNDANLTLGIFRTEVYAIATMLPAAYLFIKYFASYENDSNNSKFKLSDMYIIGILAGLNLMINIKSAILFVPFAFLVAYILIKERRYKNLILVFVAGLLGVIISILPYIIYMFMTDSVDDMIYCLFYVNAAYSNPLATVTEKLDLFTRLYYWFKYCNVYCILTIATLIFAIIKKFNIYIKISFVISLLLCLIYTFALTRFATYYMVIFVPYVLLFLIIVVKKIDFLKYVKVVLPLIIIILIVNFIVGNNVINVRYNVNKRRSEKFIEMFEKEHIDISDKKILSTAFNPEVYMFLNEGIDFKFFSFPVIKYKYNKLPYDEQYKYIVNRYADIIVTRPDEYMEEYPENMYSQIYYTLGTYYTYLGHIDSENNNVVDYYVFIKKKLK